MGDSLRDNVIVDLSVHYEYYCGRRFDISSAGSRITSAWRRNKAALVEARGRVIALTKQLVIIVNKLVINELNIFPKLLTCAVSDWIELLRAE